MSNIFVLYEERENSQLCGIRGVWRSREDAVSKMSSLIASNPLYSDQSEINYETGCSESDPTYCEEEYSNYCIKEFEV